MNVFRRNKQQRIHLIGSHANSHWGFTLTELLVVIAIIGILAGILIPVVGSVRASADSTQCVSNLRGMQLANQLYAAENNGYYLSGVSFDEGNQVENAWVVNKRYFEILTSVRKDRGWGEWENDLLCPTTKAIGSPEWNVLGANYGIGYFMFHENLNLPGWGTKNTNWGIHNSKIEEPANAVAFSDCTDWIIKAVEGYSEENEIRDGQNSGGFLAFRHNGVAHAVNFDASVDSYTPEDVKDPEVLRRFTLAR